MEKNKTRKYFKYAIGEIILVVIGILIALQINNWNESRKATLDELKLVKGLIADAKADSLFYKSRADLFTGQIKIYKNIFDLCSRAEQIPMDTIILKEDELAFMSAANYSDLVNNNIDIMEHISSDSIQNALRDYYKSFQFVTTAIELSNSVSNRYVSNFDEQYGKMTNLNIPVKLLDYKGFCESGTLEGVLVSLITSNDNSYNQTIRFLKDNAQLKLKLTQYLKELQ